MRRVLNSKLNNLRLRPHKSQPAGSYSKHSGRSLDHIHRRQLPPLLNVLDGCVQDPSALDQGQHAQPGRLAYRKEPSTKLFPGIEVVTLAPLPLCGSGWRVASARSLPGGLPETSPSVRVHPDGRDGDTGVGEKSRRANSSAAPKS